MRWSRPLQIARARRITDDTFVVPAWGVLTSDQDALTILLSLGSDRVYTLDETGTVIWKLIGTGKTVAAVVAAAAETFEPSEQVAGRVRAFIVDLFLKDILALGRRDETVTALPRPRPASGGSARRAVPSTPAVVLCLAVIAAGLEILGTKRVWRIAHRRLRDEKTPAAPDFASTVASAVSLGAVLCPWRAKCLHQSLATLFFLRRAGLDAHLRFGVQLYRFYAHAWVEIGGVPVNDNAELLKLYRPLAFFDIGCA